MSSTETSECSETRVEEFGAGHDYKPGDKLKAIADHTELVLDGSRPICPVNDVLQIMHEPTANHKPFLPFLRQRSRKFEAKDTKYVFDDQLCRWWEFRKWQWVNRGATGDEGFLEYLTSNRRRDTLRGELKKVCRDSYEESVRNWWEFMSKDRLLEEQGFHAYQEAVKRNLAPFNFDNLQLMEDPRKQTQWTTWLEYLNYEQWWLGKCVPAVEREEWQNHQAWERFLEATRSLPPFSEKELAFLDKSCPDTVAAFTSQHPVLKPMDYRYGITRKDLGSAVKAINDLTKDTERFRRADLVLCQQKNRVKWIIQEARVMEAEMLEQSKNVPDSGEGKKRKRDELDSEESKKKRRDASDDSERLLLQSGLRNA
ncbi:hypothetical protein BU24DRAFT_212315 [Aaosphaeria arxii CBS 175.79]|uniref:Uncharacterized protein n=1 Tax=Aaosphaeria arxii CBS 175.79 TaxID=1450172 RepID=A0A6A5XN90_9PLEO|nr:uncharacterized protein BU24DRAFT_212315 [Aaosphaeria arxii CBS 175.79]KAF2014251.1 hypothetical protein BU24DRAFT_212315 [Aaosphaeria arxii CBS 175.79]